MYDEKLLAAQWAEMYRSACRENTVISQATASAFELLKKRKKILQMWDQPWLLVGTAGSTDKEATLVFQPGIKTWVNIWLFKLERDTFYLSVLI